jgi:hypothetical protein
MLHPRHALATLAAIGALPMAAPLVAQAQPDHPVAAPPAVQTSSLAGTTDATNAAIAAQDKRSPDAVDAATSDAVSTAQDKRSPDAVDAAHGALIDKRSPDAVDANNNAAVQHPIGRTYGPVNATPAATSTNSSDDGTDWGEVALIGGTAAALLAIAGGTLLATQRRTSARRRQPVA